MKLISLTLAACLFSLFVLAGSGTNVHPHKYCSKMKDGKLVIMHEGKSITSTVTLTNGTQIMTDGTVIKKDGTKSMIREGQCADENGEIMKEEKMTK